MENIDIGSFNFDTNKLTDKIAANRKQMDDWKKTISDAKKSITESTKEIGILEKQIESERKAQERLANQLQKGYITQEQYNSEISKSNSVLDKFVDESLKLSKAQAEAYIVVNRNEEAIKGLRLENNELNKLLGAGRTEVSGLENKYRDYTKQLNASKIEVKNLELALYELEKQGKKDTDQFRDLSEKLKLAKERTDELTNAVIGAERSAGEFFRTVGKYKEEVVNAFGEISDGASSLKNGDIIGGFNQIISGIKGISVALITSPIGIFTAIVGAVTLGAKEVLKYNTELYEANKLTESITKLQGEALDTATIKSRSIEKAFGLDRKDALEAARALVQEFGITYEEALNRITDGAIRGGLANNEYLDSIREYPTFFAKAGFSAKEFIGIVNAGYDLAIYKDKLPDALKEFNLSIREQTKATRDALVNAFGAPFADDILKKVNNGSITVKDALFKISEESNKYQLTVQQQAQLTADIFRGAGEDAGGFQKVMDAVQLSAIKMNMPLTETQKILKQQVEQYDELGIAKNDALKSDSVMALKRSFEIFWNDTKIGFYKFLTYLRDFDREIDASARYVNGLFGAIPKAASNALNGVLKAFSELVKGIRSGGSAVASFFKGDFDKASEEADKFLGAHTTFVKNLKKIGPNALSEVNNAGLKAANDFRKKYDEQTKAYSIAQRKIESDRAKAEELKNKNGFGTTESDKAAAEAEKAAQKRQKQLEDAAKKDQELLKNKAESASKLAQLELAEYIQSNAKKYDSDKALTDKKLKDQLAYYDEIQKIQQKANKEEENSKLVSAKTAEEKAVIKREFALKDKELIANTEEEKAKIQKDYDSKVLEQKKLLRATEYQQRLLELDQQGATEAEKQRLQLEQQTQDKLNELFNQNEKLKQFSEDAYITDQEVEAARRELQDQINAEMDLNEQIRLQAQLNALNNIVAENDKKQIDIEAITQDAKLKMRADVLGGVAKLLGEETAAGKAAAIAQATMNTWAGVSEVLRTKSVLLEPAATISRVINIGTVIAQGLGAVGQITKVQPLANFGAGAAQIGRAIKKYKGYADGGLISDGYKIQRSNGDNRLITAKTGEVILNERQQALLGGAPVFSAIGVPGFARGGIVTSSSPTIQNSIVNNNINVEAMAEIFRQAVMDGAISGTYSGSRKGIVDLTENSYIANGANF
ncbi:phage tail tape measure protein [Elizabethkingia sp. M8]|uniref:phage tail tape measure protein n=1 Tax=Elizabethkingia sp. M8 TaxID=2796140 RepID=UPI001908723A|nr:phage tail tape measure protein [Elizabethkingia sp. M8]QQM25254.1 hypothetical protein JCR23_10075 [Elizabethkingia sp. M8]